MKNQNTSELFERIDVAVKKAVKNALLQHEQAGRSIHILLNGEIVEAPPEKIGVDDNNF